MSCNTVTFKRGTTFVATAVYTPSAGGPANLLTTTVTSRITDSASQTYDLTITKAIDGLSFTMEYDGSTSAWWTGNARWDIKFVYGGNAFYTETLRIQVIESVTP